MSLPVSTPDQGQVSPAAMLGVVGPPMPQNSSNAVAALLLAVLGWVAVPVALPIVALVLAQRADKEIQAARGWLTGESLVTAARWVAWINIAFFGFLLASILLGFLAFAVVLALTLVFGAR